MTDPALREQVIKLERLKQDIASISLAEKLDPDFAGISRKVVPKSLGDRETTSDLLDKWLSGESNFSEVKFLLQITVKYILIDLKYNILYIPLKFIANMK